MRRALAVLAAALALAGCGTRTEGYPVPPPEEGMPEGSPRERNLADSVEGQGPTTERNLGIQQPSGSEQRVYPAGPGGTPAPARPGQVPPGGTVTDERVP